MPSLPVMMRLIRMSGMNTMDSGLSAAIAGRSLGDRSMSDKSMAQRSDSNRSFAQTPLSHGASASSGSAHVLDLNDESFTNLVSPRESECEHR